MTLDEALHQACDEVRLAPDYRDIVRPLLRDPEGRWPRCCAGNCEPCMQAVSRAAKRALELLGTPRKAPIPALP